MNTQTIDEKTKTKLIAVLKALFPEAKIYLYGSYAKGEARPYSDIDLALDAGERITGGRIDEAKSMLRESNIFYSIDLVDVWGIPQHMRDEIKKEWILWKD